MPVGSRVVFTRFLTKDSPKLEPWRSHVDRVMLADNPTAPVSIRGEGFVVWQLVSANNRQLARSAHIHDDFDGAVRGAREIADSAADLAVTLVSERGRGVYGWFAVSPGNVVMTCARWYLTERDRRQSVDRALEALSIAELHAGARLIDPHLMGGERVVPAY